MCGAMGWGTSVRLLCAEKEFGLGKIWCDGMGLNFGTGMRCGAQMWGYAVGSGYRVWQDLGLNCWQTVSQD